MTLRREHAERFARFQRQFARAARHRQFLEFKASMSALVERAGRPRPSPQPVVPTVPALSDTQDRLAFNQAMRDLLDRIHTNQTLYRPDTESVEPWWSPSPVYGFRMWDVHRNGLKGARVVWHTPRMEAQCLHFQTDPGPFPHDEAECGNPPCGIYALKSLDPIEEPAKKALRHHGIVAIGLVRLTGRVFEHKNGYRAEKAEAVAAAAVRQGGAFGWFTSPEEVNRLFTQPSAVLADSIDLLMSPEEAIRGAKDLLADEAMQIVNGSSSGSLR